MKHPAPKVVRHADGLYYTEDGEPVTCGQEILPRGSGIVAYCTQQMGHQGPHRR